MPATSTNGVVRAPAGQYFAPTTSASAETAKHQHQHRHQRRTAHPPSPRDDGTHHRHAPNVASPAREREVPNSDSSDGMLGEDDIGGQPPAKRRKLSQTHSHPSGKQSTLDAFLASTQLEPPTKIVRREPHGRLQQTVNGVRRTLVADEDELLRPSRKPERAQAVAGAAPPRPSNSPAPPPQPSTPATVQPQQKQEEKRSLRSRDEGPRLKSELAVYFPHYEDIIFDVPKEQDFVTTDTLLYITDDAKKEDSSPAKSSKASSHARKPSVNGAAGPPATPQRSLSTQFNGSPSLNLDFVSNNLPDNPQDPLTDDYFLKSHKRAERKEKQLRNIERERAMHEKVQLDRLLDGLLGHDWLRVLGITGVTETEAKKYEPKRDYFIAEVQALVDKFKQWKDQEKKLRLVKEAAQAAKDAEDEEGNTTEGSVEPPSSDLNASAARQLQQETVNALRPKASGKGKDRAHASGYASTSHSATPATPAPIKLMLPPAPPSPELPITSFYAKPHLRDAALSKTRHGRNVTAFGLPLPEMEEKEFELPSEYITQDALRASARERRRRKRESAANSYVPADILRVNTRNDGTCFASRIGYVPTRPKGSAYGNEIHCDPTFGLYMAKHLAHELDTSIMIYSSFQNLLETDLHKALLLGFSMTDPENIWEIVPGREQQDPIDHTGPWSAIRISVGDIEGIKRLYPVQLW
ncbi:uncharacterized protein MYCFIDRAFT_79481 [Pseudocercospora fijiensis CIRAD86]|uniref:Something about silencing protein 4 domain-containing protein n=1 Tax=Pseudocercospora fijiensis (strain CIRAD86) TaxID=383855 RepID=M3APS3_PSEFD|nr:uncharacterized protein MYCFIDRAFT_79481 [Pseudocercospora fijiensis CIRAD86]EME79447.1 hypothetical protein MYCFIDRAFT_79481 [Pseudocercospora fijiensis CIRAD86]